MSATIEVVGVGYVPLNQLDPRSTPAGKPVADTSGNYWSLARSTAAVDHVTVEAVLNDPGLRWLIETNPANAISSLTGAVTGTGPGVAATSLAASAVATANLVDANVTRAKIAPLLDMDYDGWFNAVAETMHAGAPALTNFREVKIGDRPDATSVTALLANDGQLAGGAAASTTAGVAFTRSLTTTPKTTSWALAFRCSIVQSTSGHFNFIGFMNAGPGHWYGIASFSTDDATKLMIYTYNGAEKVTVSTFVNDGAIHDYVITFDGTTITMFVDGVSKATQTDISKITDEAVVPGAMANVNGDIKVCRFAYGYIAP